MESLRIALPSSELIAPFNKHRSFSKYLPHKVIVCVLINVQLLYAYSSLDKFLLNSSRFPCEGKVRLDFTFIFLSSSTLNRQITPNCQCVSIYLVLVASSRCRIAPCVSIVQCCLALIVCVCVSVRGS